jgi:hypothetical protein
MCSITEKKTIQDLDAKIARIKRLIQIENMRKPFRRVQSSMKRFGGGGISKLFVPNKPKNPKVAARYCQPDGSVSNLDLISMAQADKTSVEYATILDSEEIEHHLLTYNWNWFRQAKDTPFGQGELYELVGYDGLTEAANYIVDGDCIDYMGIPMVRELRVFLEECKRPASVSMISSTISLEVFKKAVKEWKESTSTSPSGRHLVHLKTALLDDDLASLHTDMLNLPISCGLAPE